MDIEDEDADQLLTAEERAEREREDQERKRREAREAERAAARAKLEKWASKGMDFGDYGDAYGRNGQNDDDDDDARDVARKETGEARDEDEPGARAKAKAPPTVTTDTDAPSSTRKSSPPSRRDPASHRHGTPEVVSERPGENEASAPNVDAPKPVNKWKMALAAIVKGDEPEREEETTKEKSRGEATKAALTDLFARAVARREIDRDDDDEKETNGGARRDGGGRGERPAAPQAPRRRRRRRLRPRRGMDGVTIPLRDSLRKMAAEPGEDRAGAGIERARGLGAGRSDVRLDAFRRRRRTAAGRTPSNRRVPRGEAGRPKGSDRRRVGRRVGATGRRPRVPGSIPGVAANAAPKARGPT